MQERLTESFRTSTRLWLFGSFAGWVTIALCFALVGLVILAGKAWRNRSTRYELTGDRLIIHRGVLMKSTDEIELFRIKDVKVKYSLLNQMVDIGTISLVSSDKTTRGARFVMPFVPEARRRREEIRSRVDLMRQSRRVRELDVEHEFA